MLVRVAQTLLKPYAQLGILVAISSLLIVWGDSSTKVADVGVALLTGAVIGVALLWAEADRTHSLESSREARRQEEKNAENARRLEEKRQIDERELADRRLAVQQFLTSRERVTGLKLPRQQLDLLFIGDVTMTEADFSDCSLRGANFAFANVRGSDFSGAQLCDAVLASATFTSCDFEGADLRNVDIKGATFIECSFRGSLVSPSSEVCRAERCVEAPAGWESMVHA